MTLKNLLKFNEISPTLARAGSRLGRKAVELLASRATQLKSKTLSTLLLKLRDAPTPFAKVHPPMLMKSNESPKMMN